MGDTSSTTEICATPNHAQWVNTARAFIPARSDDQDVETGRREQRTAYKQEQHFSRPCTLVFIGVHAENLHGLVFLQTPIDL